LTPCGGTHASSTGEVGVIAVRTWERAKGLTRIHFTAGLRALADYRKANQTAREVAELFSAGRDDSPALVARLVEENKKLRRRVGELEQIACRVEADELLHDSATTVSKGAPDGTRIVAKVFDDRDAESLKQLALALIAHPKTIAILGSRDGDTGRLVFARSSDAAGDMNALMREACTAIDGRGGGKPDMAQGGGKSVEKLAEAIELASEHLQAGS
ncbi:MAG: alanyl-tRNA synthetase, partial [Blastocatellia bacterium]|nr:alanyl-tRNA synthetase [Blastocatellia bacterium]